MARPLYVKCFSRLCAVSSQIFGVRYIRLIQASFSNAQRACSATTGSESSASFLSVGTNFRSPLFPMAMTAFRRRPESLARRTGDPRNTERNSSCCISTSQSSAGLTRPSRGVNSGAVVTAAFRFQADVTSENVTADSGAQFRRNFAALFDRQIGDT